ncbi:MAG: prepilin-type N-terminal cleavage/methylation domain-containing protein [Armatimonadota bacterium]
MQSFTLPNGGARRGFTLIELLVVIAIIAILAAILFPVFAKAREKANQTTCMNNQRQIALSLMMYVQDNEEQFPPANGWNTILSGTYGLVGGVWDCPTLTHTGTTDQPDYFYVAGSFLSGAALGDVKSPVEAPMVADLARPEKNPPYINDKGQTDPGQALKQVDARHNGGAVFAYVDGHVAWLKQKDITPGTFVPSICAVDTMIKPVDLGEVMPQLMVGAAASSLSSTDLGSIMVPLGFTRLAGATADGGSTLRTADASGVQKDDRTGMPSWLDSTLSLPASQILSGGYFHLKWKGATYNYPLQGLSHGNATLTKTFNLDLVPSSSSSGAKTVAVIGYRSYVAGDSMVQINSIAVTDTKGVVKTYTYSNATLEMSRVDTLGEIRARGFLIPALPGTKIVFNITCSKTVTASNGVGVSLAFSD